MVKGFHANSMQYQFGYKGRRNHGCYWKGGFREIDTVVSHSVGHTILRWNDYFLTKNKNWICRARPLYLHGFN